MIASLRPSGAGIATRPNASAANGRKSVSPLAFTRAMRFTSMPLSRTYPVA